MIEPLVAGTLPANVDDVYDDDVSYVRDLGLIARGTFIEVANPIYREVIMRVLGAGFEGFIAAEPSRFLLPDGRLDFPLLLCVIAVLAPAEVAPIRFSLCVRVTWRVSAILAGRLGGGYIA